MKLLFAIIILFLNVSLLLCVGPTFNSFRFNTLESKAEVKAPQSETKTTNEQSSSGVSPVVPSAMGIGAEVTVPCQVCHKLINQFVTTCVDQEANGAQASTFRAFCEEMDSAKAGKDSEFCMMLNAKLAAVTGESGSELTDPTKAPDICIKFQNECNKLQGPPLCYTGFCSEVAECIDCPTSLVDLDGSGILSPHICGGHGVCKLGWKDSQNKGGNGYCECEPGNRGLGCNEV